MVMDLNSFSSKAGVYLMRDHAGTVIYVGKAKNLKKRIKQYFSEGRDTRVQIPLLVSKINEIETIIVTSEKEALLLEHTLIKEHHPKYNFLLKDDKSFTSLQITNHAWPTLRLVRTRGSKEDAHTFGPYPSGFAARNILRLLQRLFPLRECSDYVLKNRTRPCILYQIKRCIAPCVNNCTKEEYHDYVSQVESFLKGNNQSIITDLKKKMKEASKNLEYEKAALFLQTIQQIESLLEKQSVIAFSKIDSDVIGIYREGESVALSLLSFQKGRLVASKSYSFLYDIQEDETLLSTFIFQNYIGKTHLPHEIITPIAPSSSEILKSLLNKDASHKVKLLTPIKGNKIKLLNLAFENAKNSFNTELKKSQQKEELLLQLKDELNLINYPETIECYDNSHLSGTSPVSVMVSFKDGQYDKSKTRKFHLKSHEVFDDLKGMEEVLLRRLKNEDLTYPDLIIIDGGKTQLNKAMSVLAKLNIVNIDVISLTKEAARHDFGASQEKINLPGEKKPIILPRHSNLLFFLQTIRDQAHKSAIGFHRRSIRKNTLRSVLDDIPGIGPKKKQALIRHFGSPKKIQEASVKELMEVSILTKKDLERLQEFFLS